VSENAAEERDVDRRSWRRRVSDDVERERGRERERARENEWVRMMYERDGDSDGDRDGEPESTLFRARMGE